MSQTTEWEQQKFQSVYDEELRGIERRLCSGAACTIADLQGILDHLYITQGNNWEGRGPVADMMLDAQIAAYEHYIAELKKKQ